MKNDKLIQMVRNGNKHGDHEPYIKWPKDLLLRNTEQITLFIKEKFLQTSDKFEYYCCIPFLTGIIPSEKLYVLWADSPNRKRMLA